MMTVKWRYLAAALLLFCFRASAQESAGAHLPSGGSLVAEIYFSGRGDLAGLASAYDIWEVHHDRGYALGALRPSQYRELLSRGYRIVVDQRKGAKLNSPLVRLPLQSAGIPGYPCYRTVEESLSAMQALADGYPQLVSLSDIGESWEYVSSSGGSGYPIKAVIVTNSALPGPKPRFFLVAETHAPGAGHVRDGAALRRVPERRPRQRPGHYLAARSI